MKQQQKLSWFSWKKVIITCIVLLIIGISIYFYLLFRYINTSKVVGFDETEAYILSETEMTSVEKIYAFQDEILYHIAYTRDDQDKGWIQFIPITKPKESEKEETKTSKKSQDDEEVVEDNKKETVTVEVDNTLSQAKIESIWATECSQCELKGSSPAILDDVPLWELTYIDENKRYVLEYRQLKDGQTYEQLKLNRKYNVKG